MTKNAQHSTEDQASALGEILDGEPASNLLSIPGIWEILSEHYSNEIIEKLAEWDGEDDEDDDDDEDDEDDEDATFSGEACGGTPVGGFQNSLQTLYSANKEP
jgi:hypothetical protein